MTLIVGLTGGIGSGKSAASTIFAAEGAHIVDADIVSREVVQPGSVALQQIANHFGDHLINADGSLDRSALRQLIFTEADAKQWLENLLHPLIRSAIQQQLQPMNGAAYTLLVSPLLLETDQHRWVNRILLIDVSEETQLERTCQRDNNSPELVKSIMLSQMTREEKLHRADDIILNEGTLDELKEKVIAQHQVYLRMARELSTDKKWQ